VEIKYGIAKTKYTYSGGSQDFAVPFSYLSDDDVDITLDLPDGSPAVSLSYAFINSNTVRILTPLPLGSVVHIERTSFRDGLRVDFTDGSTVTERDLDLAYRHSLYVAEEAVETAGQVLLTTQDIDKAKLDAQAAATSAQASLAAIGSSVSNAAGSASAAATSAAQAATSASAAATSAVTAADAASTAVNAKMDKAANLSDVASAALARSNLGLGTADSPTFTRLLTGNGTAAAPGVTVGPANTGFVGDTTGGNNLRLSANGAIMAAFYSNLIHLGPTNLRWGGSVGSADVILQREGVGIMALINATTPQSLRIYNTMNGADYERGIIGWESNAFVVGSDQSGGAGAARPLKIRANSASTGMEFQFGATTVWRIATGSNTPLYPNTNGTADFGATSNRIRNGWFSGYLVAENVDFSVAQYGAVGDYVPATGAGTDDSAAIQAALDAAYSNGGGTVRLEAKIYKLGSAITIPIGVTLRGPHEHVQSGWRGAPYTYLAGGSDPTLLGGRSVRAMKGSLWVCFDAGKGDGTGTYNVSDAQGLPNFSTRGGAISLRGHIRGVNVFQRSYDNNLAAAATDAATWNSTWNSGNFASLAIRTDGEDATVRDCYIGGFMQAILSYNTARGRFQELLIDCVNGIEVSSSFDVIRIENVQAMPLAGGTNSLASLVRRGTFIYLHDTVDWAKVRGCFTYGHKTGYFLSNLNGTQITDCGADNQSSETAGFIGMYLANANVQNTAISNFKTANREVGIACQAGANNSLCLTGFQAINCNNALWCDTGWVTIIGPRMTAPGAAWSSATAYKVGDFAISGGVLYRCILANTNQVPPNATYWVVANSVAIANTSANTTVVHPLYTNYLTNTTNATGVLTTL
jgi:hypothetical protein